jgi:hypothetical protein
MASKSLPGRVGCISLSTCAITSNAESMPDKARCAVSASALIATIVPIPIRNRDALSTESSVCSTDVKLAYDKPFFVI